MSCATETIVWEVCVLHIYTVSQFQNHEHLPAEITLLRHLSLRESDFSILQDLDLQGCANLTPQGIWRLCDLPPLTRLVLTECKLQLASERGYINDIFNSHSGDSFCLLPITLCTVDHC